MTADYHSYLERIEKWVDLHKEEYLSELASLVRIRSVAEEARGNHPFGDGPAEALDYILALSHRYGFATENDEYYTGSAVWPGETPGQGVAYVCHLDVVPEGTGWHYPPYEPTLEGHQMIGRGASDNKGSALAALFALRCLKELGVRLNYTHRVLWGCQEEAGMNDMPYFLKKHEKELPELFLVCDCIFPLHHGEKGILTANLVTGLSGSHVTEFSGGLVSNSVPDRAEAILQNVEYEGLKHLENETISVEKLGNRVRITARGISGHVAFPETTVNAIGLLAQALADSGILDEEEYRTFHYIGGAISAYDGKLLGVESSDEISGNTTAVGGMAWIRDGKFYQNLNIRYAIKADQGALIDGLKASAEKNGFRVEDLQNSPPVYVPLDFMHHLPGKLVALTEELLDIPQLDPVILAGATHTRKLPRAIGYGPNVNQPGYADPPKIGVAHGPDEAVDLDVMWRAIRVYAASLIAIDGMLVEERKGEKRKNDE